MTYTLRLRDIVIGWSSLNELDAQERRARGEFRPGLGYELVEPIFVLRPETHDSADAAERDQRYRRARDTLALSLHGRDGGMIDTARIDIYASPLNRSALVLDVKIVDESFWRTQNG